MLKKYKIILIVVIILMAVCLFFILKDIKTAPKISKNNNNQLEKILVKSITQEDHVKGDINSRYK